MIPFFKKNTKVILNKHLSRKIKKQLITILHIHESKGKLYFALSVRNFKYIKTITTRSVNSLVSYSLSEKNTFYNSRHFLKYKVWYPFFKNFLVKLPSPSLFILISAWYSSVKSLINLIYSVKKTQMVFFKPNVPFSHAKNKKIRYIKKKIKKKIYA